MPSDYYAQPFIATFIDGHVEEGTIGSIGVYDAEDGTGRTMLRCEDGMTSSGIALNLDDFGVQWLIEQLQARVER